MLVVVTVPPGTPDIVIIAVAARTSILENVIENTHSFIQIHITISMHQPCSNILDTLLIAKVQGDTVNVAELIYGFLAVFVVELFKASLGMWMLFQAAMSLVAP